MLRFRLLGLAQLVFSALPMLFCFAFRLALFLPELLGKGSDVIMSGVFVLS